MTDQTPESVAPSEPATYAAIADRIAENMAIAALRVGDAAQDLVALMNSLVAAGKELESALSIQRELGAASLKAVEQAREAAQAATTAATDAHESKSSAGVLLNQMEVEYGTVSGLVGNLQERIAALSILGAPLPNRNGHSEAEPSGPATSEGAEAEAQPDAEAAPDPDNVTEFRAAS
ncbi:MAG: hypothetical protein GEU75_02405 [Dehalococcoidia bacterium]|nr:hypothetical protein [Dehalococcoidia bacterium]